MAHTHSILLDSLVLENCTQQLNSIERILLEPVSHYFAGILLAVNCNKTTSVTIENENGCCYYRISGRATRRNIVITEEERLKTFFKYLFSRIKRFSNIILIVQSENVELVSRAILNSVFIKSNRPIKFDRFKFTLHSDVDCGLEVIRHFAPLLKVLNLTYTISDVESTKKLWTAVSLCDNLQTLFITAQPSVGAMEIIDGGDVDRNAHLSRCLSRLKIQTLKIDRLSFTYSYFAQWFADAFTANKSIQKLYIDCGYQFRPSHYCEPLILPIIARLRTISLIIRYFKEPEDELPAIKQILLTLPERSHLTVHQDIDNTFLEETLGRDISIAELVSMRLYFWLELSAQTKRCIHLWLKFQYDPIEGLMQGISLFLSEHNYVSTVDWNDRSVILKHGNAKICLYFFLSKDNNCNSLNSYLQNIVQ